MCNVKTIQDECLKSIIYIHTYIHTYVHIYIYIYRCWKKGGNKHILKMVLLKNKNRSHIQSPQEKVLVIVLAWVETSVRSVDFRLANHEIKLVLIVFYFIERFWSPRLMPRTTLDERSFWNLNT